MSNNNPVYVIQHNHFDPIWRRCWDRTFDYKGKRYRSYADVEERVINFWLENAKRGAAFSEGQSVVFRKYLERNPDRLEEMRELVDKGIIEITAAGETVADTNMPSGETLLRNLVLGQRYFEETFGVISHLGWVEDAFGLSAQLPQLFRGIECKQILRICYTPVPGTYFKGLDGSVLYTAQEPCGHGAGHCQKSPPCPACNGIGCDECEYTGFADYAHITDELLNAALHADYTGEPFSMMVIGGEEAVPNLKLPDMVEQARKEQGVDFRYGGFQAIADYCADAINKVDDPNVETADILETNPVSTGCYVSRIKIKQRFREIENMMSSAEKWATAAYLMGADYPGGCLLEGWRNLVFVAFHDAITCSHIDAAYYELLDMLSEAEHEAMHILEDSLDVIESNIAADPDKNYLMIYNSESWERNDPLTITFYDTSVCPTIKDTSGNDIEVLDVAATGATVTMTFRPPAVPAFGYTAIELIADSKPMHSGDITEAPGEIENEFYTIKTSDKGIVSIFDKRIGKELLDNNKYLANELILEEDIGNPWATRLAPSFEVGLSKYTTGIKIRKAANVSEIILTGQYKGDDESVKKLTWKQSTKLYAGIDRIDFSTDIDWDTANRRIRVAFPTNIKKDEAVYSIPYGAIERPKYEPIINDTTAAASGDWPAINWVDLYNDEEDRGIAIVNSGTPSHKVDDGIITISLLRSPAEPHFLNEPEYYTCPDCDGARDAGTHEFSYAIIPHTGDYRVANIEKRGREFNMPLFAHMLSYSGEGGLDLKHSFIKMDATDNIIVTAIKKAERDDSIVIRLAETAGEQGEASIAIIGAGENASLVNFLERNAEPVSGKIKFSPFKIMTVQLSE